MRISGLSKLIVLLVVVALAFALYFYWRARSTPAPPLIAATTSPPTPHKGLIAFVANPNGNWDLFLTSCDDSQLTQLTQNALDKPTPEISPNGRRVAYSTSDR